MAFGFSSVELRDLAISVLALGFAFNMALNHGNLAMFPQTLFIIVIAFAAHEVIGHKLVAQHFGYFAEYRMWTYGLVIALASSFLGFIFAAPGAVYISPVRKKFAFRVARITERENGIISLGGPAVNIVLGFAMVFAAFALPAFAWLFFPAAQISFWLAIFNLIPFPPLDGSKVLAWSKPAWILAAIAAGVGFMI
ncbi:MAG: site-2 protease family protein [Candidatus Aenigmatarchaeota archaeon]